jgi:dipeptidyl aminopeptidase/acylaminoacyl peptidase
VWRGARLLPLLAATVVPAAAAVNPPQVAFKQFPGDRQAIVRLDETGGGAVELTQGKPTPSEFGEFSWSPDGSQLVYSSDGVVGGDLYVLGADGTGLRRLTFQGGNDHPAWSPDGRLIVYVHTVRGPRLEAELWLVSAEGGSPSQITMDGGQKFPPAWSPDGSRLAYTRFPAGGDFEVRVLDVATRRVLMSTRGFDNVWSPDGSRVAVQNGSQLEVVDADGGGRRTVARNEAAQPQWSPDGSRIAFSRSHCVNIFRGICGGHAESVYEVGADGRGERRLTGPISGGAGAVTEGHPNDGSSAPAWWPDGSRLFFFLGRNRAFVMNADGTCERPFGPRTLFLGQPVWRPGSMPSLPPLECVDLRARAVAVRRSFGRRERARMLVVIENDGNRSATELTLTLRVARGRGRVRPPLSSCRGTAVVRCNLAPLAAGASSQLFVTVVGQRPPVVELLARVVAPGDEATTTALATVLNCDLVGTRRADRLVGTRGRDAICGLEGPDVIVAGAGNDIVKGDAGDDKLVGGPGRDKIWGSKGRDRIHTRDGRPDDVDCGLSRDTVFADNFDRVVENCERVTR